MKLRGRSETTYCIAHIWCWPTPVVTITSVPAVSRWSASTTCWGLSHSSLSPYRSGNSSRQSRIWPSHASGAGAPSARCLATSSASAETACASGPTTGMSASRSLEISAGSMSRWTTVAPGAKAESLPVTRSSKRAPIATRTSQVFIARFDHLGPCIPGQPKWSSWVSGKALLPISVVMTGSVPASASCSSSAQASPFRVPPPTYSTGLRAWAIARAASRIWSGCTFVGGRQPGRSTESG